MESINILGLKISKLTQQQTVMKILSSVQRKKRMFVVTANPEIVMCAHEEEDYYRILQTADIITPDGIGVVKGARILGERIPERVAGYDLFLKLLKEANEKELSIYLLGAKEIVLAKSVDVIKKDFPNVNIVGHHHGYFNLHDETIVNEIKDKNPDFVFVALGFPRQEEWISRHISNFEKGVFIGLGGSFDVIAGETLRAPDIWIKLNVEWLYRLIKQPSRWRRMLSLPHFIIKVLGQKLKNQKNH
ncbi:WecB/TagA/CpsF family glycosyltransferase [Bacillus shivajii]|uniref:WecB/TagA/CpsF family glycosyltransferase n=1 Tax=Bacillus shivajii TaxID=1983719 RepID=UPI001CFA2010|nr:WecB/TagA/CpsF family glycosyltransferase [Bacillus shivajii]UCZ52712.1 WecB/TagA/CpsF family glycosyltransferase [Bacillus shivajii]